MSLKNKSSLTMRATFYTVIAYGTLVVDAYLALASIATRVGVRHLPPFGSERVSDSSRLLVIVVATWTAVLVVGCFRARSIQPESPHAPGILWFLIVLAAAWLAVLLPLLASLAELCWNLFVRGL